MESLSLSLQPYKDIVGQVASIVTIAQFFAGTLTCKDIYEKKSTKGIKATPFIGGVVIGLVMLKLAYILNDTAMFQVNIAAILLNSIYCGVFLFYSEDQYEEVLKPAAIGVGIVAFFFGYAAIEDPMNLEFRYGLLSTNLMLSVMGAPLMDLKEIMEKKDASSIPLPLTFMATIVTFLWLFYGIIIMNNFMIIQNLLGLMLCSAQLYLLFIYPGPGQNQSKKRKKMTKKD